jgi:hypothetical protein
VTGFGLLHGIHREPPDRIGHTGVNDIRHDENPPEMRCLVAIRVGSEVPLASVRTTGCLGWIAPQFPHSKASQRGARGKVARKVRQMPRTGFHPRNNFEGHASLEKRYSGA